MKVKEIKWQDRQATYESYVGFIEDYWYPLPHLFIIIKTSKGGWWCLLSKLFEGGSHNFRSLQACKDKAEGLLKEHLGMFFEEGRLEN